MTIRRNMLAAARAGGTLLGEDLAAVGRFLRSRLRDDGAFRGRSDAGDLYYTVFGLEGLLAANEAAPADRVAAYLRTLGDGADLDFVHLACLVRCWADLEPLPPEPLRTAAGRRLESFRSADGGYAPTPGARSGTAYACFLALSACQDLGASMPDADGLAACLATLRAADGGYANVPGCLTGVTPATAAAACVLRELGCDVDDGAARWLLSRCGPAGGFAAADGLPVPDLLSTATALHALWRLGAPLDSIRPRCLAFVRGLRSPDGGFRGHWAEDSADCEYTYYGLLALGHLAERRSPWPPRPRRSRR